MESKEIDLPTFRIMWETEDYTSVPVGSPVAQNEQPVSSGSPIQVLPKRRLNFSGLHDVNFSSPRVQTGSGAHPAS
jgi:hypothetical protein